MEDAAKRREVLEALSRYQKKGSIHIDEATIDKMVAEESDRGLIIILGSFVEDRLVERIFEKLPDADEALQKALTKPGGALRDFATRTAMARALGIIDESHAVVLDVLRAMRNACAHCRQDISFTTPELHDALALLLPDVAPGKVNRTGETLVLQVAFIALVGYLLGILSGETMTEASNRVAEAIHGATAWVKKTAPESWPQTLSGTPFPGSHWLPKGKGHPRQRKPSPE